MHDNILVPLGLNNTVDSSTAQIPEPVLHAFSSERRATLGIGPAQRFYEESTYCSPSWTLPQGAIQTTNIYDMTATAVAIGEGTLLSPESHRAQIAPDLLGFGSPLEGCPNCRTPNELTKYGLGVGLPGSWILQSPLLNGYSAVEAYLPSKKIAVAIATTYGEQSFDEQGNHKYGNASENLFVAIAAYLAPDEAPSGGQ